MPPLGTVDSRKNSRRCSSREPPRNSFPHTERPRRQHVSPQCDADVRWWPRMHRLSLHKRPPLRTSIPLIAIAMTAAIAIPAAKASQRRTALVRAVARVQASVVNIRGEKTVVSEKVERRFGPPEVARRVNGMGSGVVIDPRGYVLTNFHVVDGVRKLRITLSNGKTYSAHLLAQDENADLAIIKVQGAGKLPVIDIGASSDLMLAERVIAVGNPYGYEHTVTRGIISQLRRTVQVTDTLIYKDLIQTDASINPGNSGGPLLNADGKMIGVVVAVRAGAQGIAFAIPVDRAMKSAAAMLRDHRAGGVWHGAAFRDDATDPESPRLVVQRVDKESPAARAGLKIGDVVSEVDGLEAHRQLDFERALLGLEPKDHLELSILRDGEDQIVKLELAAQPDENPVWRLLGLRLKTMAADKFKKHKTGYRGGLKVLAVRAGSPAHAQGIRRGDVLLGMHIWETISPENVKYILKRPDFDEFNPLKFFILRDKETLYGHMRVSMHSR